MGGSQSQVSNIGTQKGQGYRILSVRPNSPIEPLVDPFFDFIIDIIPSKQPQKSPKQILSKLTENDQRNIPRRQKNLQQIFKQNQNSLITMRIVSTKYRNVKTVEVTPNSNWNEGSQDLMGVSTRLQRYDQAFQTYFPFSDIRPGSPVKKSGINEGQYLIGCLQFQYNSINQLLQNLYDRYFDKAVQNKTVNFAVYNLVNDQLKLVPVLLSRGWGEKGLLGCQFLEGHLNRFPKNLGQIRDSLKLKKKMSDDNQKIKKQLSECNGASVQLIQSLKSQKNRKKKNVKHLKNILLIQPFQKKRNVREQKQVRDEKAEQKHNGQNNNVEYVPLYRYKQLQNRVATLEQMLSNVRNYIEQIQSDEQA